MYLTRKHYRKQFTSAGRMVVHGGLLKLTTMDISIGGTKVHLNVNPQMDDATSVDIFLDDLEVKGQAVSVWSKPDEDGGCYMGLKFEKMAGDAENKLRYC